MISLNTGNANCTFGGDCISEFGIGCVQVADAVTPATTKGVLLADAEEWKVQGRSGSHPIKSDRVDKMVSDDTAESAGGTLAAANVKPAWLNNLSTKGLPVKAQTLSKRRWVP